VVAEVAVVPVVPVGLRQPVVAAVVVAVMVLVSRAQRAHRDKVLPVATVTKRMVIGVLLAVVAV
jgi:hypothetical protein